MIPVNGVPLAMNLSAASLISWISSEEKGCVQRSGLLVYSSRFQAVDCAWVLVREMEGGDGVGGDVRQ